MPGQTLVASGEFNMLEGHDGFTDAHYPAVLNCIASDTDSLSYICGLQERKV